MIQFDLINLSKYINLINFYIKNQNVVIWFCNIFFWKSYTYPIIMNIIFVK